MLTILLPLPFYDCFCGKSRQSWAQYESVIGMPVSWVSWENDDRKTDITKFPEKKTNNVPRVLEYCVKFDELELVRILTDCRNYRIPERFEH